MIVIQAASFIPAGKLWNGPFCKPASSWMLTKIHLKRMPPQQDLVPNLSMNLFQVGVTQFNESRGVVTG
jgi:hypothetical protein